MRCIVSFLSSIRTVGLEYFLIGGVPTTIEPVSKMILLHNYPDEWVRRYTIQNYFADDPVCLHCLDTTTPFFWEEAEARFAGHPASVKIMKEAREHGLAWGVCLPLHNINGCEACICLSAQRPVLQERDLDQIQLFCAYVFNKAKLLKKNSLFLAKELTPREREVLMWLFDRSDGFGNSRQAKHL